MIPSESQGIWMLESVSSFLGGKCTDFLGPAISKTLLSAEAEASSSAPSFPPITNDA